MDLRKMHPELFKAKAEPALLEVPELNYLMIDGHGDPGGEDFQASIGALYQLSYTMKFQSKARGQDFTVMALEGDYRWQEGAMGSMDWTLMTMQPDLIGPVELEEALLAVRRKKGENPYLARAKLQRVWYGMCVHLLHVGPYDQEKASIDKIEAFMITRGLRMNGVHHEIYISDPNRVAPERLKTIIRYPVREIFP